MKTRVSASIVLLALATFTALPAWAGDSPLPTCPAKAESAVALPDVLAAANNASTWCVIWCPSPPYSMNWNIACEANYCGTTYMSCVGGYSLSCEQCEDAYDNGGPYCLY